MLNLSNDLSEISNIIKQIKQKRIIEIEYYLSEGKMSPYQLRNT